jgi:arginine/lysine/ornithine decarboxylase
VDLGADLCCDSAHKTLPGLTGTAYLHIADKAPAIFGERARDAMALFGSTSPSYLLLASLDAVNGYLADGYSEKLAEFIPLAEATKSRLVAHGWTLTGDEPLKITICTKTFGYTGRQTADLLLENNIVCEFSDPDHLVIMLTPEVGAAGLLRLETALLAVPRKMPLTEEMPRLSHAAHVMSVREAMMSPCEMVPAAESAGRVLAAASVGCPPAVPIVVCGERIDETAVVSFAYYGIEAVAVVQE